ncbi:HupE/UreJ family protein [Ferrimonas futtsuensis]|uniref:HupE/UreJ family protein n=1 Tax=Ferrimonas futtsuensis TaxID=364764 RepID=UPI000486A1A2|nr:HupE/UreJ family protein [Ferrimonas futtsuensis]
MRNGLLLLVSVLMLTGILAGQVRAHELQPSSLELRQLTQERFEVIWRAPLYYRKPHPAQLRLPESWQAIGSPTVRSMPDSQLHRQLVAVSKGRADGAVIRFVGLESTITDVFVRFVWLDGQETTAIARPSRPWVEVVAQRSGWQIAQDYAVLGVEHILSGFDHLTFVLALMLLVRGARRLLITVTSFTVAHSITLAAATLGVVWVPAPPVEAVIALSILFLAGELVKVNRGIPSLTADYPWSVAFAFGLLHGFGFAGALGDLGLPQHEVPLALLMFNLGVELGQLLFVGACLALLMMLNMLRRWPAWMKQVPAYGIGGIAAYWLIERVSGF